MRKSASQTTRNALRQRQLIHRHLPDILNSIGVHSGGPGGEPRRQVVRPFDLQSAHDGALASWKVCNISPDAKPATDMVAITYPKGRKHTQRVAETRSQHRERARPESPKGCRMRSWVAPALKGDATDIVSIEARCSRWSSRGNQSNRRPAHRGAAVRSGCRERQIDHESRKTL
jgi:hypothetical protein